MRGAEGETEKALRLNQKGAKREVAEGRVVPPQRNSHPYPHIEI